MIANARKKIRKSTAGKKPGIKSGAKQTPSLSRQDRAFRFFDNREKYLMFVTTCSEKWAVAQRVNRELQYVEPGENCLTIFDAGVGDGTILSHVMRSMHERFTHVPWLVVCKEISMEDVRLVLEKMADRFHEHPEMVLVFTNMYYSESPALRPNSVAAAATLNWHEIELEGDTSHEFDQQIRALQPVLASDWQVKISEKTGNPHYVRPSVLVLYRKDRRFGLRPIVPRPGQVEGKYNLVIASQPYRARVSAELKVKNVLKPLARAVGPGGRMVVIQSYGEDPGMEIINRIWPGDNPFHNNRKVLIDEMKKHLNEPEDRGLKFTAGSEAKSLFQYHLHTLPSEVGGSIGTSTLMAAWNAATYVAQVEDSRVEDVIARGGFLEHVRAVVNRYGGLWFNDESFVVSRRKY